MRRDAGEYCEPVHFCTGSRPSAAGQRVMILDPVSSATHGRHGM